MVFNKKEVQIIRDIIDYEGDIQVMLDEYEEVHEDPFCVDEPEYNEKDVWDVLRKVGIDHKYIANGYVPE